MHCGAVKSEAESGGRGQEVWASKATGGRLSLMHPGLPQQGQGWDAILFEKAHHVGCVQARALRGEMEEDLRTPF